MSSDLRTWINAILSASQDLLLEGDPVLLPAIKYNGKVFRGKYGESHLDLLSRMTADLPLHVSREIWADRDNRGFVTHTGHFLDRRKAQAYAVKHHLLHDHAPLWAYDAPELATEMLHGYREPPESHDEDF
jgi:hypothetical protein